MDESEFVAACVDSRPMYLALSRRMLPGRLQREAEDVVSDAILGAWKSRDQYRGEAALSTWIARCVVHRCFNFIRHHDPLLYGCSHLHGGERVDASSEARFLDALIVEQLVGRLAPKMQAVLWLWAEGAPGNSTMRVRTLRAKRTLRVNGVR